jgi:gluconokinase
MSIINAAQAARPLILALDVGTSSVRSVLYDSLGRAIEGAETRSAYEMQTTPDGGVEMDADHLLLITCQNLDALLRDASDLAPEIAGVGMCTFWHSLLGIDNQGQAITPIYNWNDTRSAAEAAKLAERFGREWIQSRTGTVPHASYYPAKILWLRRTNPALYRRVSHWVSFGEYLYLKLFGRTLCSLSMASGTGLFNPNTCAWDEEMLKAVGIEIGQLSPLGKDSEYLTGLRRPYAERWPVLAQLPWLPAYGDGACSNIGSGCVTSNLIALMVGTSGAMRVCWPAQSVRIPPGLWCYRANGHYVVMGGALSNGGNVYSWCQQMLRLDSDQLEEQLAKLEADGHGLTVLPFFSGERSTGWADYARATITGLRLSTRPVEILRAMLEAVSYRFAAIYDLLHAEVPASNLIVASGGGILNSPVWTQMMADVIGVPVVASAVSEASSRGAALLALQALGYISDLSAVPAPFGAAYHPDFRNHERYQRGRKRQQRLYEQVIAPGPELLDIA